MSKENNMKNLEKLSNMKNMLNVSLIDILIPDIKSQKNENVMKMLEVVKDKPEVYINLLSVAIFHKNKKIVELILDKYLNSEIEEPFLNTQFLNNAILPENSKYKLTDSKDNYLEEICPFPVMIGIGGDIDIFNILLQKNLINSYNINKSGIIGLTKKYKNSLISNIVGACAYYGNDKLLEYILENYRQNLDININTIEKKSKNSKFHFTKELSGFSPSFLGIVGYSNDKKTVEILKIFEEFRANFESKDFNENNIIHIAAREKKILTLKFLIESLGLKNIINEYNLINESPYIIAQKNENKEMTDFFDKYLKEDEDTIKKNMEELINEDNKRKKNKKQKNQKDNIHLLNSNEYEEMLPAKEEKIENKKEKENNDDENISYNEEKEEEEEEDEIEKKDNNNNKNKNKEQYKYKKYKNKKNNNNSKGNKNSYNKEYKTYNDYRTYNTYIYDNSSKYNKNYYNDNKYNEKYENYKNNNDYYYNSYNNINNNNNYNNNYYYNIDYYDQKEKRGKYNNKENKRNKNKYSNEYKEKALAVEIDTIKNNNDNYNENYSKNDNNNEINNNKNDNNLDINENKIEIKNEIKNDDKKGINKDNSTEKNIIKDEEKNLEEEEEEGEEEEEEEYSYSEEDFLSQKSKKKEEEKIIEISEYNNLLKKYFEIERKVNILEKEKNELDQCIQKVYTNKNTKQNIPNNEQNIISLLDLANKELEKKDIIINKLKNEAKMADLSDIKNFEKDKLKEYKNFYNKNLKTINDTLKLYEKL